MPKENLKFSGVYRILSICDNKCYIGSAVKFNTRWVAHLSKLRSNKHKNRYLQFAWNKYGESNFIFEVLEVICDKVKLTTREQFYINLHQSSNSEFGYNLRKIAHSNLGLIGYKHTEETKLRLSKARKGTKLSEEIKNKMSKTRTGKKASEEAKLNMSKAQKNRNMSKETKSKMVSILTTVNIGRKQSADCIVNRVKKIRKLEKWPCLDGHDCKCGKCLIEKRLAYKRYRETKKLKKAA